MSTGERTFFEHKEVSKIWINHNYQLQVDCWNAEQYLVKHNTVSTDKDGIKGIFIKI